MDDNSVYCLNATTGEKIWDYFIGGTLWSSPAVAMGNVYIGSPNGNVYAFGLPPYDVTIQAYYYAESAPVSVSITMDGAPTGYNTSHTFAGLNGTHNFTVPNTDPQGHTFTQWNTDETNTTITITSAGTYTAYYETPQPVGGIWVPVDKLGLVAPYIALASTIVVAAAATAIYVKHAKRRKEKQ